MEVVLNTGLPKQALIRSGKVKDIYDIGDDMLLFHFTDRVSAFDVVLPTPVPGKGSVLCRFAAHWFEALGVPHHMLKVVGSDRMVVKKLRMIPVECVVRGYLYGSLYERCRAGEVHIDVPLILAARLPQPVFDPTTKSEVKDVPITKGEAVHAGLCSADEYDYLKGVSIGVYERMAEVASSSGFIMADLKLEFGRNGEGGILLADSIGPDEFRLWPKEAYRPGRPQESFDKQLVRDWLISVGYKKRLDETRGRGLPPPPPPRLPDGLVEMVAKRYIEAYERLTGRRFKK